MDCAELQGLLLADCQERCIVAEKCSQKSSTIMQDGRFVVAQESLFQASNRSYMGSAVLVGGRFDDIQEFFFLTAKR